MKKVLTLIIVFCMAFFGAVGFTACGEESTPQKLSAPTVTLTENVAAWEEDLNADKFEISLDGNLSYVENTVTSKTLTDGQTLKLRAVGNGINYTTSDWSNSVTYTAGTSAPSATKLSAPTVTLSSTGLASWSAVANASGYAYKINGGAETQTAATSVQLTDGQSIQVKAVGDGTNYTDSDYSTAKTYTAGSSTPTPTPTQAPTYIGITASTEEPSANDASSIMPMSTSLLLSMRVSLEESLRSYLSDSNNALGDTVPMESDYQIYSSAGNTVYIQIWLNNPDQNTILSLKLNGMKYQSGGALQSFFVEDGDSYLNCVYVAVTIPANTYQEVSYEVTEIEYVEGANISQDGKSVLIDQDKDTVAIGLPYEQSLPTVEISNATQTASSISFNASVSDEDGFVALVGGWLRVIIYDQNNQILAQQKLTNGNNTVTFNDLSAETYYNVMAFVLADTRDGNGVYVHTVASTGCRTESVLSCNIQSELLQNAQTGKYYPSIRINAQLSDSSFSFTKVEVCNWSDWGENEEVLYTAAFDGAIDSIVADLLNGQTYVVKVYYKNASNIEQAYRDYVHIENLEYPWLYEPCLAYGLIDDAILGFDFGTNKSNFDNLTIKIIDEYSKQYLAEDALYLLDNPNAVAELEAQWNNHEDGWEEIYDRWYKLDKAQTKINTYYSDVQKAEWQAELEKGIYVYEYVYGKDEQFFRVGNKYYVVLDGYQSQRVNEDSWKYTLSADFDMNNGEAIQENRTIVDGFFNIKPALTQNDYLFAEEFTLDENNVLYLETKSRNNLGNESYRALGYVSQIVLRKDNETVKVLWSQEKPNTAIDESAWIANIKTALIAGEDIDSVFPLGNLQPITFDLDNVDFSGLEAGQYEIMFAYQMYGKEYTQDNPCDYDGYLDYIVKGPLPTAGIEFRKEEGQFGRYEIDIPESLDNGYWSYFNLEIRDENEVLLGTYNQDTYQSLSQLSKGYSIRVKLVVNEEHEYYTDGEWSEWFYCTAIKCDTPANLTQSCEQNGVRVSWDYVQGASAYVYVLNGGAEQETGSTSIEGLKDGDTLKVKAKPANAETHVESDYTAIFTVNDERTKLSTPVVTFDKDYLLLEWQAVENADYYQLCNAQTGEIYYDYLTETSCSVQAGIVYIVKAIPNDYQTYCASSSNSIDTTVKLDAPEVTISETGAVRFSRYSTVGKVTYTYVINDGEEQTTNSISGITLQSGDRIKVKVSCEKEGYLESEWSETYTYTAA